MNKTDEQTEIISMWVTPKTAKEVDEAKDPQTKEAILADYARSIKVGLQNEIDMLEEDVLEKRALTALYKKTFREVKQEQLKQLEEVWDEFEKDLSAQKKKAERISDAIKPLKKELEELKILMGQVRNYDIENLLSTLNEINRVYHGETREMLQFLFKNYKTEAVK